MVPGYLSDYTGQERHLGHETASPLGYFLQCRLANEAQAYAMMERDHNNKLSGLIELLTWAANVLGASRDVVLPVRRLLWRRWRPPPNIAGLNCGAASSPRKGFRTEAIKSWSQQHLTEGSTVISDGLACFNAVVETGLCAAAGERLSKNLSSIGSIRRVPRSTYHAIRPKYVSDTCQESFRITKHDLKVRSVYHWIPSRETVQKTNICHS